MADEQSPEKRSVGRRTYLKASAAATVGLGTLASSDEIVAEASAVSTADPSPSDSEVGGGPSYDHDVTESDADATVSTKAGLKTELANASDGDVVWVDSSATIDMTGEELITIPSGVTLASGRGIGGSQGALLHVDEGMDDSTLFKSEYETDVRVTGLQLRGPHTEGYFDPDDPPYEPGYVSEMSSGIHVYNTDTSENVEIDNCHLWGWTVGAVRIGANNLETGAHVHHCSIHTNAMEHLGYGIDLLNGESLIEYNYFDLNRHCICGGGDPTNGYEARYNVVDDRTVSHAFDMHNSNGSTNVAGGTIDIHHNTFRYEDEVEGDADDFREGDPQEYIHIRGPPENRCDMDSNWFVNKDKPDAGTTGGAESAYYQTGVDSWTNMYESNNAFGPEEPSSDVGAPRTGDGGGGGGATGLSFTSSGTAVDPAVDSNGERSGVQFRVTNNFDTTVTIAQVHVTPSNSAIDELTDHSMDAGQWVSELYVDADVQDSACDVSGLSLPGSLHLTNDGHSNSDQRWAIMSAGSDAWVYLYQFEDDGSPVDMVGESVEVSIDWYRDSNGASGTETTTFTL